MNTLTPILRTLSLLLALMLITQFVAAQEAENATIKELGSMIRAAEDEGDMEAIIHYAEIRLKKIIAKHGEVDSLTADRAHRLAAAYYSYGDLESAYNYYEMAKDIRMELFGPNHDKTNSSLQSLGMTCEDMSMYDEAKIYYLAAIKGFKNLHGKNSEKYANAINNLAGLYYNMREVEDAELLMIEAMDIRKEVLGPESAEFAYSMNNLAILYWSMDRFEAAEPLYLQALSIKKDIFGPFSQEYANSLNNLAVLYVDMKKYEQAEAFYQKVLKIYSNTVGKEHYDYAMTLINTADMFFAQEAYEKALPFYKKALEIRKKALGKTHSDYGATLDALAQNYHRMKRYEEAEKLYLEAKEVIANSLGETHLEHFVILNNLTFLSIKTEQYEAAQKYIDASILLNSKENDPTIVDKIYKLDQYEFHSEGAVIVTLGALHKLLKKKYEKSKNVETQKKAYMALETSIRMIEKRGHGFKRKEDKLRVLNDMSKKVGKIIKMSVEMGMDADDQHKLIFKEKAFGFAEHNKSVLLADAIQSQRAKSLGDLPDSLAIYESDLEEYRDYLKKAEEEAESPEEQDEIRAELNALNQEMNAFVNSLKDKYPKYHALKYKNITASALDIQKLLKKDAMFIEYFVSGSATFLFAVTKDDIQVYSIEIKKKALKEKVRELRNALSNYKFIIEHKDKSKEAYSKQAYWFYKELLAPALEGRDEINELIIIPDYELGHLPFEAFLTEPANQASDYPDLHYLLKDYQISYNYSATLWKDNKTHPAQAPNGKMLACAGDYRSKIDTALEDARGKYICGLRKGLKELPAAQEELKALSEQFNGDFVLGSAANEAFFKKEAPQYGVIHLAMHGIMHPRVPILSSLAFTENQDSLEDNFLQAYEISHLQLNAELVVLSACETGYGKFEQGEGVLSMARSFMYAGVPSLVVSLWQVNDESTSIVMQQFYANLADGMNKAEALRQAKLAYIKRAKGLVAHPAFWSPFVQIGDNRPIQLDRKGLASSWLIGGGLLLGLLFIIVGMLRRNKKEMV